jgi:hypothetical protein
MEEQKKNIIFSQDIAAEIVELFEKVLDRYDIVVPSPEDDERGEDNGARLYGSVYSDLLDSVEDVLLDTLNQYTPGTKVVPGEFSGTY